MLKAPSCSSCHARLPDDGVFLSRAGTSVCRLCFYAVEQADAERRAEQSTHQIGLYDLGMLLKKLFVAGMLLLVGIPLFLGSVRNGDWRDAGLFALCIALGAAVLALAMKGMRQPR